MNPAIAQRWSALFTSNKQPGRHHHRELTTQRDTFFNIIFIILELIWTTKCSRLLWTAEQRSSAAPLQPNHLCFAILINDWSTIYTATVYYVYSLLLVPTIPYLASWPGYLWISLTSKSVRAVSILAWWLGCAVPSCVVLCGSGCNACGWAWHERWISFEIVIDIFIFQNMYIYTYSRNGGNGRRQRMTSGHAEDTNFNIRLFVHLRASAEECDMIGDT